MVPESNEHVNPFRRFLRQVLRGELQMVAASLSFTTVMSIIPFFAVGLAVLNQVDAFDSLYPKIEALVLNYFQGPAGSEGVAVIKKIFLHIRQGKLGIIGACSLVVTSILLLKEMEFGINRVWGITKRRSVVKRFFSYWAVFLLLPLGLAAYVGISSQKALQSLASGYGSSGLNFAILFLLLFWIYKSVPNILVSAKSAAYGALAATIGLGVLIRIFSWLTKAVFNYNKLYGSMAAIPALLIWILLLWYVVLGGVAITASIQEKDHKDDSEINK